MGWSLVIPAILLGGWAIGSAMLARRSDVRMSRLIGGQRGATSEAEHGKPAGKELTPAIVEHIDDPRLVALRQAAERLAQAG